MGWLTGLRDRLVAEGFYCERKDNRVHPMRGYLVVRHGIGDGMQGFLVYEGRVVVLTDVPLDHPIWRAVEIAREEYGKRDAG